MLNLDTNKRGLYRGHVLTCKPLQLDDGRHQARVAIAYLGDEMTVSQRFLDLDVCGTRDEAVSRAYQAAVAWVDLEWKSREFMSDDRFLPSLPIRRGRTGPP